MDFFLCFQSLPIGSHWPRHPRGVKIDEVESCQGTSVRLVFARAWTPAPRTTDTQWRHKSKISEKMGRCGRQNMLPPYLKIWEWEWIFGRAVKAISSLGVRSPWVGSWLQSEMFLSNSVDMMKNLPAVLWAQCSTWLHVGIYNREFIPNFFLQPWQIMF